MLLEIDRIESLPYTIAIQDRRYTYTYQDLGVLIDREKTLTDLFAPNRQPFPLNLARLCISLFRRRNVSIPLVYTQGFHTFVQTSLYDFSDAPDEVQFDSKQKSLVFVENEERYKIDEESFRAILAERVGNNALALYPRLMKVTNESAMHIADTGSRIKSIFMEPLMVYVETGGMTESFVFTEKELSDFTDVKLSPDQSSATVTVQSEKAIVSINEHMKQTKLIVRGSVASPKVLKDIEDALISRYDGYPVDAITLNFDKGPNTTGSLAAKYIEIDISQQNMYLFKDNKLVREFRVSTGKDYPTPIGEFAIINKVGLGFSNIYDVWLPWWMGFNYSDTLHAYFGIHELPYVLSGNKQVYRPGDVIGVPNTGGCVALGVGDAKTVYQFADIGTKVAIYP